MHPPVIDQSTISSVQNQSDIRPAQAPSSSADSTRIPALTGLRGIAVLLVVLQHSWLASHHDGTPLIDYYLRSFNSLWFGVDIFFVLSGFLLTGILLKTKDRPNYFRNFYARRCLRIFPLYYAFVFAVVVGYINNHCYTNWSELPWVLTFLTNISICLQHTWSVNLAAIPICHFWSLSVEEHFYIAWPIVVKKSAQRLFWFCVAGIAATTLLRCTYLLINHDSFATNVVHVLTPFRMDGLLAGAAVACIHQMKAPTRKQSLIALLVSGCAFAALAATTHLNFVNPLLASIGYTIIAIAAASLVSYLITPSTGDGLRKLFSHSSLLFFGQYSYAIYIMHLPIATLFNLQIRSLHMGTSPTTVVCIGIIAPFVCTVLLSMLSWHILEKQALKLKAHFS